MFNYLRAILYYLLISLWTIILGTICFPLILVPNSYKFVKYIGILWSKGLYYLLVICCNLRMKILGLENLPTDRPYIIAAKHHSALEIIVLNFIANLPKYVLKKSLIFVPFMGLYCYKLKMIFVDRSAGMKSLKTMLKQVSHTINNGESVLIFPEGTRTKPGKTTKYNPGIIAIYQTANVEVIPVALNTGLFWPRNSIVKKSGIFTIEFLKPIKPGLNKNDFMKELQNSIEERSNQLINE